MTKTKTWKFTATCGSLKKGDMIGRATVRYATPTDTCSAWNVYIEGAETPRRYGRNEVITITRAERTLIHTIVELKPDATPIRNVETFEDWGLAMTECGKLNANYPDRIFEVVSEPTGSVKAVLALTKPEVG